ncbi:hypothetical protein GCM10010211_23480 [Streptomyces albospinus]|uniref:Uncharacterized protein n=1 Tax=Streptomyces albospinus TaxID=285515 RepID=A0ABQ2UYT6_9ACTN|nr:hypothetical protein [Streptomyces albospinus]GGU57902.1 hypothetical protein GCM10010211_23480 [Streptomyces albospinus]
MSRCTPTYVEQKNLQRDDGDEGTAGREASGERPAGMPKWISIGARVLDTVQACEAVVHGIGQPYVLHHEQPSCVWLRPPGGGLEWCVEVSAMGPLEEEPCPVVPEKS